MKHEELIKKAIEVRDNAYAPYSNFQVGCAILLKDGQVYTGANVENASYGLSNCAERSAFFAAYSDGYRQDDVKALAIVADTESFCSPCGACRQVIHELVNEDTEIILTNLNGITKVLNRDEVLPFSFGRNDL
ncbi:cytidine deaminase [Haloplasma contractile]|uniref:Cytidine deaminase n=1 Tax=Haloplasma contractile SSD-17B TaxID=1033810 RepID=U2E066_9MOLU|nr:cytidine deaminase [Haloplasma contractile]ERJ13822.1 Cytidine deaminase protein [Haloplasma contractile SSD-17B]